MSRPVPRLAIATDHELLSGYARFCATLGLGDGGLRDRLVLARAFLGVHPDLDAWLARPLPTRLADLRRIRAWPLLSYLALEGAVRPDIDLLLAKNQGGFGLTAERYWAADFERARAVATRLGWAPNWTRDVVRETLPLVLVWSGKPLGELSEDDLERFRSAVEASPAATRWSRRSYNARLFSIGVLLFELGTLAAPPRRAYRAATLTERFAVVPAPEIRRAMLAYVGARSAVLARSSLEGLANDLILFGEYLDAHHPEVGSLRALERRHVEGFLVWNRTRPWRGRLARPQSVSISVAHEAVLTLRNFLDDITLWGWAERPARRLVFALVRAAGSGPSARRGSCPQAGGLSASIGRRGCRGRSNGFRLTSPIGTAWLGWLRISHRLGPLSTAQVSDSANPRSGRVRPIGIGSSP